MVRYSESGLEKKKKKNQVIHRDMHRQRGRETWTHRGAWQFGMGEAFTFHRHQQGSNAIASNTWALDALMRSRNVLCHAQHPSGPHSVPCLHATNQIRWRDQKKAEAGDIRLHKAMLPAHKTQAGVRRTSLSGRSRDSIGL